jgi:hypothetical protein
LAPGFYLVGVFHCAIEALARCWLVICTDLVRAVGAIRNAVTITVDVQAFAVVTPELGDVALPGL